MNQGNFEQVQIQASGELSEFINRFNDFVRLAQSRISELETNKSDLVVSSKLLTYKQSKVESVLQALPEAVMVFDETGNVSYANSKVSSLLNVPVETIINNDITSWLEDSKAINTLKELKIIRYRIIQLKD